MFIVKIVASTLLLLSLVAQAKPVINGSNLKSYLDSVQLSVVVDRKNETFKFAAEGVAFSNGQVVLAYPKLVLGKKHYAIALDPSASLSSSKYRATKWVADEVCKKMGRVPKTKSGVLDAPVYAALFDSVQIDFRSGNGLLYVAGDLYSKQQMVLSVITCE